MDKNLIASIAEIAKTGLLGTLLGLFITLFLLELRARRRATAEHTKAMDDQRRLADQQITREREKKDQLAEKVVELAKDHVRVNEGIKNSLVNLERDVDALEKRVPR
jgi:uncharacterized membrane protein YccC